MAKANLVDLPLEPKDEGAVKMIGDLMDRIKAGEVSSVAVAVCYRDGCTGSMNTPTPNRSMMIGALAQLQHRLMMKDYE